MFWDMLKVGICLVTIVVVVYAVIMEKWEYRAVYHYDCASYMTES